MTIIDLLQMKKFDTSKRIKLVRHMDKRCDFYKLVLHDQIETYQSYQSKDIFNCDYIISFIGGEGSRAIFYGVYKILGVPESAMNHPIPEDFLFPEMANKDTDIFYNLKKVEGFEDFENTVVIEWGKSALAWHQHLTDKKVIEILPKGKIKEFPGYLSFIIDFMELQLMYKYKEANNKWKEMLSAVNGIYLIVDTKTGMQYIGSTYGTNGIWGRWEVYAKTGHGNNKKLEENLLVDEKYMFNYQFSILQTLSKSMTKNEIIGYESFYKKKLGSRAFGLNMN
ncbi:MAG: GIY-YIG nuclease family protein [Candidatus Delongbacteria bacterium]|nr:GIY-YIG nuclease family protein [Candidatus Delongbacteria bacterium]